MLGVMGGCDMGDLAAAEFRVGGGGRKVVAQPKSSFSLGWEGFEEEPSRSVGKRVSGPMQCQSKDSYAMELRAQIAAKGGARDLPRGHSENGADHWSVKPKSRESSLGAERNLQPLEPQQRSRDPSPFGRVGNSMVDPSAKSAAYASHYEELRAQISANAANKAREKHERILTEREEQENLMPGMAIGQQQTQHDQASKRQADKHRIMEERADALERFMCENKRESPKDGGGQQHAAPAGARRSISDRDQPRQLPPRPQASCPFDLSELAAGGSESQSMNRFANGQNQNCGNVITGRPSSKVSNPPGGRSSFSFA
eukprot:gnl/TRDRNA2_/TRDRNA2_42029_c0_seq1.p1 gnl/TRDRNA2_/TRDRNA2_42029_c0~~gnl/TRDRNA2_/TRDRNA2_42029_c0_seq1.p1  ORF type:complete len:315 (-),score=52.35 gnl/TRDRNA2_/TRDRNA2_42029_c0_seq1:108-1052(-)